MSAATAAFCEPPSSGRVPSDCAPGSARGARSARNCCPGWLVRLAVLDIGSNTAHLVVVDGGSDGVFRPVADQRAVLRLADSAFPSLSLPARASDRLVATVGRMLEFAGKHRVQSLVAFATSAIREATNGMEVLGRIRTETGVPVSVLPGADEARLTYLAARAWVSHSAQRLMVIDIGGG